MLLPIIGKVSTPNRCMSKPLRVAFLLADLTGGGLERVVLNLLKSLVSHDLAVDLVVAKAQGSFLDDVPLGVRVIDLQTPIDSRTRQAIKVIPPMVRYLRRERPNALISNLASVNAVAVVAKALAGIPLQLALVEHNLIVQNNPNQEPAFPALMHLMRWLYPQADAIVAVSQGIAQRFETDLKLKQGTIQVIHNPVVDDSLWLQAQAPIDHPWFQPDQPPVFLTAGRFVHQKDYALLLQSFAQLQTQSAARLLILGDGPLRSKLQAQVAELGLADRVAMPGFSKNPYAYMSRAAAFVLSSRWEGLPTVLIEALACGCNVISTDCPYGPDEILEGGRYGRLVPVANAAALAVAMQQTLEEPIAPDILRNRAQDFGCDRSAQQYLKLIGKLTATEAGVGVA